MKRAGLILFALLLFGAARAYAQPPPSWLVQWRDLSFMTAFKATLAQACGDITQDDVDVIAGKFVVETGVLRDVYGRELARMLTEQYGAGKDEAEGGFGRRSTYLCTLWSPGDLPRLREIAHGKREVLTR